MFVSEAPLSIFQPVDPSGPAHQGNQTLQKLAQGAAQNVLRRQRMRALLAQGARGAAGGSVGGSVPTRSSVNARPVGVRSRILDPGFNRPGANNAGGLGHGNGNGLGDTGFGGVLGAGGGGYDYPSLPDPNDASQGAAATHGPFSAPPSGFGVDPSGPGNYIGADGSANTLTPHDPTQMGDAGIGVSTVTGTAIPGTHAANGLLHLGNGLFYDPVNDAIHGAPTGR